MSYIIWAELKDSGMPEARRIKNDIPPLWGYCWPKEAPTFSSWLRTYLVISWEEPPHQVNWKLTYCGGFILCLQIIWHSSYQKLKPSFPPLEAGPGCVTAVKNRIWHMLCCVTLRPRLYRVIWLVPGSLSRHSPQEPRHHTLSKPHERDTCRVLVPAPSNVLLMASINS